MKESSRTGKVTDGIETMFSVRSHDSPLPPEEFTRLPRRPVYLVLDHLRSAFNVGAIFRTADAVRAAEIICCGYTCHPPHKKLAKTSLGTDRSVPWRSFVDTSAALACLHREGVTCVALETTVSAVPYHRFEWPLPVAIVLGNEALGVSQSALALCDAIVELPVAGFKNSLNVATAAAVVLYEICRQQGWLDRPAD
ncbi:MAG: RNA methyltransferase [candidate division WOR-3 bacterium]